MRTLLFALLVTLPLSAQAKSKGDTPLPIVVTECTPSALVDGSVNVITGDYIETQTDLTLPGPQPLVLKRFYASSDYLFGSLFNGWRHNQESYIYLSKKHRKKEGDDSKPRNEVSAQYLHLSGTTALYRVRSDADLKRCNLTMEKGDAGKGLTNCRSGLLSGRTNVTNTSLSYNSQQGKLSAETGSGAHLDFLYRTSNWPNANYFLKRIFHPNRVQTHYSYNKARELTEVHNENGNGTLYNSFRFLDPSWYQSSGDVEFRIRGSDEREVCYHLKKVQPEKKGHYSHCFVLKSVERPEGPDQAYEYVPRSKGGNPLLAKRIEPNGRFLETRYYTKGEHRVLGNLVSIKKHKDPRVNRVKQQLAPVGIDATPVPIRTFIYDIYEDCGKMRGGQTSVFDAYQHKTDYLFNSQSQLTQIKRYTGTKHYQLYSTECFNWSKDRFYKRERLVSHTTEDGEGNTQACRVFVYDDKGNVVQEGLLGNLSGKNSVAIEMLANGMPKDNGCECDWKEYVYSNDSFNLVTEEKDSRKTIRYTYHPGTDLIASKLTVANGLIKIREFFTYDAHAALVLHTIDDGFSEERTSLEGVSEQTLYRYYYRPEGIYSLPEVEEKRFLDLETGQEHLLEKKINGYSMEGRLVRQDFYDRNNDFRYTLSWGYDHKGNCIEEVNALGEATTYAYDENGNKIEENGPMPGACKQYTYDYCNRLIALTEIDPDGTEKTKQFRYDFLGNKVGEIDPYGNETEYLYDALGRLINTLYPTTIDSYGYAYRPEEIAEHTVFNHLAKTIDPQKSSKSTLYTLRGDPSLIIYSDGTKEEYTYNLDGTLSQTVDRERNITDYTYDFLARPKEITHHRKMAEHKKVQTRYSSFHTLSETDETGETTDYSYYPSGELETVKKGGKCKRFTYDSLGRIATIEQPYGKEESELRIHAFSYDLLNRVIEERVEDKQGTVFSKMQYGYDTYGNRTHVEAFTEAGSGLTVTTYNREGNPLTVTDPQQNTTHYIYRYDYTNEHGHGVPYVEITDPLGNRAVQIGDTCGHLAEELRYDPMGQLLQHRRHAYDASGNRVRTQEAVIRSGEELRQVNTLWTYDSMGRIISRTDGAETLDEQTTTYTYCPQGLLQKVGKPDGTEIHYTYDANGNVIELSASDDSVHYTYKYDSHHNLTFVRDHFLNTETHRTYDEDHRIISETLANGLTLKYAYDGLDRLTQVTYPDGTGAVYSYDAAYLRKVVRTDRQGKEQYSSDFLSYDLSGNVTRQQLVGSVGHSHYAYDLMGRKTSISAPSFVTPVHTYDGVGNLVHRASADKLTIQNIDYTYDGLYQLTQEEHHTYRYDSLYNRIEKDDISCTYDLLNQLLTAGDICFKYDQNGNCQHQEGPQGSRTFRYDALCRLVSVTDETAQVLYTYDAFNRRVTETVQSYQNGDWEELSTTHFLFQGDKEVGAVNQDEAIVELRILGVNLKRPIAIELGGKTYIPLHDTFGNLVTLLDQFTGTPTEIYHYSAFGERTIFDASGERRFRSAVGNPWGFGGHRSDTRTGYLLLGHRHYDPEIGRFLSPDAPLGKTTVNRYVYRQNHPTGKIQQEIFLQKTLEKKEGTPSLRKKCLRSSEGKLPSSTRAEKIRAIAH